MTYLGSFCHIAMTLVEGGEAIAAQVAARLDIRNRPDGLCHVEPATTRFACSEAAQRRSSRPPRS